MAWIVDSHCHLDYEGIAENIGDVLARAEAAGVGFMLAISSRIRKFDQVLRIA